MVPSQTHPSGLHLLDRRSLLASLAGGLGGIALGSLLASDAKADPDPLAPKLPHFAPKAKRVLHIFCSGAVSHLDTWDYKPELVKRHGQAMPTSEKLITSRARTATSR